MEAKHWMCGSGLKMNINNTEMVVFHRNRTSQSKIQIEDVVVKSKQSIDSSEKNKYEVQLWIHVLKNFEKILHKLRNVKTSDIKHISKPVLWIISMITTESKREIVFQIKLPQGANIKDH